MNPAQSALIRMNSSQGFNPINPKYFNRELIRIENLV